MTMITEAETPRRFVPGMGVEWPLPLYDPCTWLLRLDRARQQLLRQAELRPGLNVLDIGCGTGSLAVLAKRLFPAVEVVGVDPDEKALSRAARKARRAGVSIQFAHGFSDDWRKSSPQASDRRRHGSIHGCVARSRILPDTSPATDHGRPRLTHRAVQRMERRGGCAPTV